MSKKKKAQKVVKLGKPVFAVMSAGLRGKSKVN